MIKSLKFSDILFHENTKIFCRAILNFYLVVYFIVLVKDYEVYSLDYFILVKVAIWLLMVVTVIGLCIYIFVVIPSILLNLRKDKPKT